MFALSHINKLKNYIKTNLNEDSKFYSGLRYVYRKYIFPIEYRSRRKGISNGFESKASLYMCSLLPKKTLDFIINYYKPKTWLDVGCGTGSSLKYVKKHGIKIMGLENSALAIKVSKLQAAIKKHDLTIPLDMGSRFDVVWCYEVAEHLPETSADTLINTLIHHGDYVVLSAAVPGQGGEGHINEQPSKYWISKMLDKGFIIDKAITQKVHALDELYSKNVYCFKRITFDSMI